jgi:NUMOD3 motif
MNKYKKWYYDITSRGQSRISEAYSEKHHILPRSLGGSNEKSNITSLTAREHFICHWLLTKIYNEGEAHWKMLNALRIMRAENKNQTRYETKITSRVYQNIKEEYSRLQSEKNRGENNGFYGKKHNESAKKIISEANKGEKNGSKKPEARLKIASTKLGKKRGEFSEEWKQNLSTALSGENNGMWGKTHTDETKEKQRQKAIGRKQSDETKKKKADAVRGSKREKKLCPHCQEMVAVNTYPRWHGDNCKKKA